MRLLGFFILFCILATNGDTYRILGLLPYNARSHFVMFTRLMKGLVNRGHQVDVAGNFPLEEPIPNYNDIIDFSADESVSARHNNLTWDYLKQFSYEKSYAKVIAIEAGNRICHFLGHPRLEKIIKNPPTDPPYDLIITEIFGAQCFLAMGQHLGIPIVAIATSAMWPWANDIIANPDEPAFIPHVFSGLNGAMNFWQRMQNTLLLLREKLLFKYYTTDQDDMIRKYIGPHAPSVRDAEINLSLILVNSHFSFNGVRPFTTAVVEVGGLHIPEHVDPLPKDMQKWLDDSKAGFVYISYGSMMKMESLPEEILRPMYASIAKLSPIRVLIKIANPEELPPGLPKNVLTKRWLPQLAILHHKNIRAFMTHGGLMGTQEAVHCGVPMIGLPIFADQHQNIEIAVQKNIAESLRFDNLTEESLDNAFNKVLRDPSYMKAAKKVSAEFRDRPMSALDTATFWVEYVIRHGGANLRSPAMDLSWWQISLLDVYAFLIFSVIFIVYLVAIVINEMFRRKHGEMDAYSKKVK